MSISPKSLKISKDKADCLENVIKSINSGKTLEEVFDIMMEMDDIIDFSSYKKGFELIAKYGVEF